MRKENLILIQNFEILIEKRLKNAQKAKDSTLVFELSEIRKQFGQAKEILLDKLSIPY
jgi:hypothetical protein